MTLLRDEGRALISAEHTIFVFFSHYTYTYICTILHIYFLVLQSINYKVLRRYISKQIAVEMEFQSKYICIALFV